MSNYEAEEVAKRNRTFGATSGVSYVGAAVKEGGRTVATTFDPAKINVGEAASIEGKVGENKFVINGTVSGKDALAVTTVIKKDAIFGDKTLKLSEPLEVKFGKDGELSEQSKKNIQAVLVSEHTKGEVKIPSGIPLFPKTIKVTDITDEKADQAPKQKGEKRASIDDDMRVALAQVGSGDAKLLSEIGGKSGTNAGIPNKPSSGAAITTA